MNLTKDKVVSRWIEQKARCEQCGREIKLLHNENLRSELPKPWREFTIEGWVAVFTACCVSCEKRYIERYQPSIKKRRREKANRDERDTIPHIPSLIDIDIKKK
jgi:uncharacterized protein with PIN domain